MKVKTAELTGPALDWAVARAEEGEELSPIWHPHYAQGLLRADPYTPSTNWAQGGPIIELEEISTAKVGRSLSDAMAPHPECWCAHIDGAHAVYGPTPLIAAMRCYVASKLCDEVEVPDALC